MNYYGSPLSTIQMPKESTKKKQQQQAKVQPPPKVRTVQDGIRQPVRKATGLLDSMSDAMRLYGPIVSGMAKIVGMGDYTVESNTISTSGSASQSVPNFPAMRGNRLRHKECLGVITAPNTTEFAILKKIQLNPGLTESFPWLAAFAGNFTGYKVHGAAYVFESNTSEYSAVPYMGTLCIGTRYDTREPDFSSMVEMQNCKFSVSAKPSQNIIHPIECKDGFQPFDSWMVRRGNENSTLYGYDKCNVFVAAEGLQASTNVLGRLWVTYDIELINPVTPVEKVVPTGGRCVMADTGGNSVNPNVITGNIHPVTALFNNWNDNVAFNLGGEGVFNVDIAKYNNATLTAAPYAVVMNEGTIRVYKPCVLFFDWKVTGTSLTNGSYSFQVKNYPSTDGSGVVLRRTQGTGNSSTFIGEGSQAVCVLTNPQVDVPPAQNSYYIEFELINIGGTITNVSASLTVAY